MPVVWGLEKVMGVWGDEGVGKPPGMGGTLAHSGLDTVLWH